MDASVGEGVAIAADAAGELTVTLGSKRKLNGSRPGESNVIDGYPSSWASLVLLDGDSSRLLRWIISPNGAHVAPTVRRIIPSCFGNNIFTAFWISLRTMQEELKNGPAKPGL